MTFDVESLQVSEKHKKVAAYIAAESGKKPSAATVALVLTLSAAYEKSDAAREEKEARRRVREEAAEAARQRKVDRLNAKIAEAQKLADALQVGTIGLVSGGTTNAPEPVDPEPGGDAAEPDEPAVTVVDPEPTPVAADEKPPANRKTSRGNTIQAVPDADEIKPVSGENDERLDTSAIVVSEQADEFAEFGGNDDADSDWADGPDEEEY